MIILRASCPDMGACGRSGDEAGPACESSQKGLRQTSHTQEGEKANPGLSREAEFGEEPTWKEMLFVVGFYLVVGKEWQICNTIFL